MTSTKSHDSSPVRLTGELDPNLSRWLWLVKWFLAIPHYVMLAFLLIASLITTLVAGVAILITGRYPRSLLAYFQAAGMGTVKRWSPSRQPTRLETHRCGSWRYAVKRFLLSPWRTDTSTCCSRATAQRVCDKAART